MPTSPYQVNRLSVLFICVLYYASRLLKRKLPSTRNIAVQAELGFYQNLRNAVRFFAILGIFLQKITCRLEVFVV